MVFPGYAMCQYNSPFFELPASEFVYLISTQTRDTVRGEFLQFSDVHFDGTIASKLEPASQVNSLVNARSGKLCHYCLPSGFDASKCDGEGDAVKSTSCVFRCSWCTVRNQFYGDRPRYITESLHQELLHRCKHVVAADRAKAKGQLSNVVLTHSALTEHKELIGRHSYEANIAHCVRAELQLLACDAQWDTRATPTVTGTPSYAIVPSSLPKSGDTQNVSSQGMTDASILSTMARL